MGRSEGPIQASLTVAYNYQAHDELAAIDAANQATGVLHVVLGLRNPLDIPTSSPNPFQQKHYPVRNMKGSGARKRNPRLCLVVTVVVGDEQQLNNRKFN